MILVAVDDFLFRSKIRTDGQAGGRRAHVCEDSGRDARAGADAETDARDLRSQQRDNGADRNDCGDEAGSRSLPRSARWGLFRTLTPTRINAARQAGVDEVLARSAFAGNLGDILLDGWSGSTLISSVLSAPPPASGSPRPRRSATRSATVVRGCSRRVAGGPASAPSWRSVQPTGSYKIRGAFNVVLRLIEEPVTLDRGW